MNEAYRIEDITEFGKLMAYCIEKDISVWRTYWNENEKDTCYFIDWKEKRCCYSSEKYYRSLGYDICIPIFKVTEFGIIDLIEVEVLKR